MSLYDGLGLGAEKDKSDKGDLSGWSSGIKLLQSQLQLKKAVSIQNKIPLKKSTVMLPPVIDLKSRIKEEPEEPPAPPPVLPPPPVLGTQNRGNSHTENRPPSAPANPFLPVDPDWNVKDEYDPMWPNDYEKIIKEQRERKEKEREEERRRDYEERRRRNMERHRERDDADKDRRRRDDDEPDREKRSSRRDSRENSQPATGGAAIAPPPSLLVGNGSGGGGGDGDDDDDDDDPRESGGCGGGGGGSGGSSSAGFIGRGGSVAMKIMAKYGFKEGQGLGRQEQGMSQALQVEKTSKRGGKIIHEKDIPAPKAEPPASILFASPAPPPPNFSQIVAVPTQTTATSPGGGESITEVMKNPSKVVLLRNMVGPGEVDEDLEPEVKEECSKYGEVQKCVIFEIPTNPDDESVRIFVEFKRMESAIKAVVDLNGRYFGGRIVKGGFYNLDKFRRLELGE